MPTKTDLLTPMRRETDAARFSGRLAALAQAQTDLVLPQSALTLNDKGAAEVSLTAAPGAPFLLAEGVADRLVTEPTRQAWRQLCDRLSVPVQYADRLVTDARPSVRHLAADTFNTLGAEDDRMCLARLWAADDGWVLRAVLSDRYEAFDNWQVFSAAAGAMTEAGVNLADCETDVDITPDRFRMRVAIPGIAVNVPDLLGDYRMPFSMRDDRPVHARPEAGETPPVLWAGIEIANGETGGGAFTIAPRAVVLVCRNGLTRPVEFRRQHIGARLDAGPVTWSDETRQRSLELIRSQVGDAVRTFCSAEYLDGIAAEMRAAKGVAVTEATAAVQVVAKRFDLTEREQQDVLACFIRGGDETVLGVGQAITAAAQYATESDRQSELEAAFWQIIGHPSQFVGAA